MQAQVRLWHLQYYCIRQNWMPSSRPSSAHAELQADSEPHMEASFCSWLVGGRKCDASTVCKKALLPPHGPPNILVRAKAGAHLLFAWQVVAWQLLWGRAGFCSWAHIWAGAWQPCLPIHQQPCGGLPWRETCGGQLL